MHFLSFATVHFVWFARQVLAGYRR